MRTAETYSNISPALFCGGAFCGGVDPRREQYAGEDVAGVEVPDYKTKYEALQNVIKDNYQLFEVDYYGIDNDNYVDGEGFCCEPKAQAKNARSLPTENVDYEKLQYYYHSDHLGSASYITNLDGEVVQHIEYVPFGEVFLEERNNTWNTPFLFNGKELDEETGLYYYGARYYNPKSSQFISTDRYTEKYPDASPYQYCLNNPVNALEINGDSILSVFDRDANKLYVVDYDHYEKGLPTFYATPDNYETGGIYNKDGSLAVNQVLIIEGVFSGGEVDSDGNITYGNDERQLPIPSTDYEILEHHKSGWHRLDAIDSKPRNDIYDNPATTNSEGEQRNAFRSHLGGLSWGCLTFNKNNKESVKGFNMFQNILNNTSTKTVRDRMGVLNSWGLTNTQINKYGTLRVK